MACQRLALSARSTVEPCRDKDPQLRALLNADQDRPIPLPRIEESSHELIADAHSDGAVVFNRQGLGAKAFAIASYLSAAGIQSANSHVCMCTQQGSSCSPAAAGGGCSYGRSLPTRVPNRACASSPALPQAHASSPSPPLQHPSLHAAQRQ